MYDSIRVCNMVPQLNDGPVVSDLTGNGEYIERCIQFDMTYSDTDSDWAVYDSSADVSLQFADVCNGGDEPFLYPSNWTF